MLSFLKRSRKGKIEENFRFLTPEGILSDLDKENISTVNVGVALCLITIYGGLSFKKSNDAIKNLRNADPDRIIVEIVAFDWALMFRQFLKTDRFDIYDYQELADAIYDGEALLVKVLNDIVDFEVNDHFTLPYHNVDILKSTEILTQKLLDIGRVDSGDVKETVGIDASVKIHVSSMLEAMLDESYKVLTMYARLNKKSPLDEESEVVSQQNSRSPDYPHPIDTITDYDLAVRHHLSWTNQLEAFLIVSAAFEQVEALTDEIIETSYELGQSYKVTACLIAEGIHDSKTNRHKGFSFLKNLRDNLADDLGECG